MGLSHFCRAVYRRKQPITSQAKFVQKVFRTTGSSERIDDEYARKLFTGNKPISEPLYQSFPSTVNQAGLYAFLFEHMQPALHQKTTLQDRCNEIAAEAGLPSNLAVELEPFIWALTDWFNAIIHDPGYSEVLEQAYRLRAAGSQPETTQNSHTPLYKGDRVDVLHPPSLQDHKIDFYGTFTHKWVLKNIGSLDWIDRVLVCINPHDIGIRPSDTVVSIPNCVPSQSTLLTIEDEFKARGQEGLQTSKWEMRNLNGDNCFPGSTTQFNVVANVVNPNRPTDRRK